MWVKVSSFWEQAKTDRFATTANYRILAVKSENGTLVESIRIYTYVTCYLFIFVHIDVHI